LVADVKVGFQTTDFDNAATVDGLGVDAILTYTADEKFSTDLIFSKDLIVGFNGEAIDNTSTALTANYRFSPVLTGNAMLLYGIDAYESSPREDDYTIFQIGASFVPAYFMSVDVAYMFLENDSNDAALDFKKNTLTLSLIFRY